MSHVKNGVSYLYLSSDDDDFVAEKVNARVGNKTRNKRKSSDDDDVVILKGDDSGMLTSTVNTRRVPVNGPLSGIKIPYP